jgi:bifunctional non-homologous end joining protein LigD
MRFRSPPKRTRYPAGPDWIHEIKHDGYRMMRIREQDRVRLISRGGNDWARHFPLIVAAAVKLRQNHFVIDGDAVVLRPDGISDFDALHSGKHGERAQLYAFDMLAGDGDFRPLSLLQRKANLARLLKRRVVEGIVSKRHDRAYGGGRCKHLVKVKNPTHLAYSR